MPTRGFPGSSAFLTVFLLSLAVPGARSQGPCDGVSPVDNVDLDAVAVATGLSAPLYVASPPGDTDRLFIVEQGGTIRFKRRGDPPGMLTTFLDLSTKVDTSGSETGLLGLAFDPDFDANGRFYVNYTESPSPGSSFTVVARYELLPGDPDAGDPGSETRLVRFPQPQLNHNGGLVLFGPDGFLYVFSGDGGFRDDEGTGHAACGNGQALDTLLGKILRIDVRGIDPAGTPPDTSCMTGFTASSYTVPSSNPLTDGSGGTCDEIWAIGLRNPWRAGFDALTGDLYTGDVGQDCWEEINRERAPAAGGENYGWRQMEGAHCFDNQDPLNCDPNPVSCGSSPACNDPSLTDPVFEYAHPGQFGCTGSVIGGTVYRGCRMPGFDGTYFFGDNCFGFVKSLDLDAGGNLVNERDWTAALDPDGSLVRGLTSFGVDARNEIYITDAIDGEVLKILPPFPDLEVSGPGVSAGDQLLLGDAGDWTWEDLAFSTMHPVDFYRVYRGTPGGALQCIHATADPGWVAGDPAVPGPGAVFGYVVTAVSGAEESDAGDPPRTLVSPCPAP